MYKYEYIVECRLTLKYIYLLGDAPLSKTEIFLLYTHFFIISCKKLVKSCVDCLIVWKKHVNTHYCCASRYNLSFKYQCVTNNSLSKKNLIIPRFCEILYAFPRFQKVCIIISIGDSCRSTELSCLYCLFALSKKIKYEHLNK